MPEKQKSGRFRAVARWLRRVGPFRSLAIALGLQTLLLLGCYALTDRGIWSDNSRNDAPPRIEVDRTVRVRLLGRRGQSDARLAVASGFNIAAGADGRQIIQRMSRLSECVVRPAAGAGIEIGGVRLRQDDILIQPDRDASIILNGNSYRGLLRIQRVARGLTFTNHVDVEAYLRGVLRGELPRNFHPQAFKAQCVAARTYVLYQMKNGKPGSTYDVLDNEGSQMYIGVRGEDTKAVRAVDETCGEVCVCDFMGREALFCTYYSSACGGRTQSVSNFKPSDPNVKPLCGGVKCDDCYLASFYRWGPVTLSKEEVTRRIVARYPSVRRLGTITGLRFKEVTADGRVIRIQLDGSTGQNETLIGEDFRLSVGGRTLKSTNFEVETKPKEFIFKNGKGYGHGVGLCQHGMETKARRGMDYRRILAIYYPDSRIKRIYR